MVRNESSSRVFVRANETGSSPAFTLRDSFVPVGSTTNYVNTIANVEVGGNRVEAIPSSVTIAHETHSGDALWGLHINSETGCRLDITQPAPANLGYGTMDVEFWFWSPSSVFAISSGDYWYIDIPAGQAVSALGDFALDKVQFTTSSVYLRLAVRAVIQKLQQWKIRVTLACSKRIGGYTDFYGFQRCILSTATSVAAPRPQEEHDLDDSSSEVSDISWLFENEELSYAD